MNLHVMFCLNVPEANFAVIWPLAGRGKLSVSFLPYKVFADRAKCRLSKEGSNKFMIFDVVDFSLLDSSSPVHSYRTLLFPHRQFAV